MSKQKRKSNLRRPKVQRATGYKSMSRKSNRSAGRTVVRKTTKSKYGGTKRRKYGSQVKAAPVKRKTSAQKYGKRKRG